MCNFYGLKGHKETGYLKKLSEKAAEWYKEKSAKTESASSNVNVSLMPFDPTTFGVKVTLLQANAMTLWLYVAKKIF